MRLSLTLALVLAAAAAWFASARPDGLERVAADLGFLDRGREGAAVLAGYAVPGLADPRVAGALAGGIGVLLAGGALWGLAFNHGRSGVGARGLLGPGPVAEPGRDRGGSFRGS